MFYVVWIQTKYKKEKNEISYEHSYNSLFILNKLQIRFVTKVCGWEDMDWEIKEEEDEYREIIIGRVSWIF